MEFQDFKIQNGVHQVSPNEAGSQNFSFLALNTAELAAPQISSKNPRQGRQRRVTDGKKIRPKVVFHMWKVKTVQDR
jgi:hypothetical protein